MRRARCHRRHSSAGAEPGREGVSVGLRTRRVSALAQLLCPARSWTCATQRRRRTPQGLPSKTPVTPEKHGHGQLVTRASNAYEGRAPLRGSSARGDVFLASRHARGAPRCFSELSLYDYNIYSVKSKSKARRVDGVTEYCGHTTTVIISVASSSITLTGMVGGAVVGRTVGMDVGAKPAKVDPGAPTQSPHFSSAA